jgi:putative membrane protein
MSDGSHDGNIAFTPRVIEVEARSDPAPFVVARPQVIVTDRAERVVPTERGIIAAPREPARRRDRIVSFGIAGVAVLLAGWVAVDAAAWISAAFDRSTALGILAATAVTAGVGGAGAVIAREIASLMRLKSVEAVRRRFSDASLTPAQTHAAVADVLAVLPRDREIERAIEAFQRQIQAHHGRLQQIELFSRTVIKPLDRRAESHVRTSVLRAFGITAISPTALTDAVFFLAFGVRMVRGIAGAYGHRPTTATTLHLLRRLVFEAGKLGAVDLASASLVQHLGGAVTERFAASTADALYAAYRMARLGIIVMDLCRPIAFREDEIPSVPSLVGGVVRRRPEAQVPAP